MSPPARASGKTTCSSERINSPDPRIRGVFSIDGEQLWLQLVFDAGDQAHGGKHGHHGGAAVAEKGQRDADHRGDAQAHAHVDDGLEGHGGSHADAQQHIEGAAGLESDAHAADDEHREQDQHRDAADHTQLLADTGEDKVRVLAGKGGVAVLRVHAGGTAGGQGDLALVGLPVDAVVVGVDTGIIGGQDTLFLIVLQEVFPQQRHHGGHRRAAQSKPVEPHAQGEKHGQEDAEDDGGASQVRGDHNDGAKHQDEIAGHQHDGLKGVDVPVFLQEGHLLGGHHDVDDLDDLGGLDADACEADPCEVAGAVVLPEKAQSDQQQHLDADQDLPLTAQQVRIDDREQHEGADAQEDGEDLHDDLLVGVHLPTRRHHAGGGPIDHHRAEDGADHANDQQEHIRPLGELLDIWLNFLDDKHFLPGNGESTKTAFETKGILSQFWSLRNGHFGGILWKEYNICVNNNGWSLCRHLYPTTRRRPKRSALALPKSFPAARWLPCMGTWARGKLPLYGAWPGAWA